MNMKIMQKNMKIVSLYLTPIFYMYLTQTFVKRFKRSSSYQGSGFTARNLENLPNKAVVHRVVQL